MGYSYDGQIKNFWPDNTKTEFFLMDGSSFDDLHEQMKDHFQIDQINFSEFKIESMKFILIVLHMIVMIHAIIRIF